MQDSEEGRATTYREAADRFFADLYDTPMSLDEFVDQALDDPSMVDPAANYLLEAIESQGKRSVIEEGETKERWRFFDDPYNDGEHAVLGNTDTLNRYVKMLRSKAGGHGNKDKIAYFQGSTATGKSELKRCLINGLNGFSREPDGRRYTIAWNPTGRDGNDVNRTFDGPGYDDDSMWTKSGMQTHPLLVYPSETREAVLEDIDPDLVNNQYLREGRLDPESREVFDMLLAENRQRDRNDLFSHIVEGQRYLQVENYHMDLGSGIGILHTEEKSKNPLVRLTGNPRNPNNPAGNDNGALLQGNGGVTIIEDAAHHLDVVTQLLNVAEENQVKDHNGNPISIDTEILLMANPDFESQLNQFEHQLKMQQQQMQAQNGEDDDGEYADLTGLDQDSARALRRRLRKFEMNYLTNMGLETELIRREVTNENEVWEIEEYGDVENRIQEPMKVTIDDRHGNERTVEFAPHAIEAAAMYSVVTRLDHEDIPSKLEDYVDDDDPDKYVLVKKALLYDQGFLKEDDELLTKDAFDFGEDSRDGELGLHVTYTRDIFSDLIEDSNPKDRYHDELAVEDVRLPQDVIDALKEGIDDEPTFAESEKDEWKDRAAAVEAYVYRQQEEDVLDAIIGDMNVHDDAVEQYFDKVIASIEDDRYYNDRGERVDEADLQFDMKRFEIDHLGTFTEKDYKKKSKPKDRVQEFRQKLIDSHRDLAMELAREGIPVSEINAVDIPELKSELATNDWAGVKNKYNGFDPSQWEDPINQDMKTMKQEAIEHLVDQGYSEASAELTTRFVMEQVENEWD